MLSLANLGEGKRKAKTAEVAALSKLAGAAGQSKEAMWSALDRLILDPGFSHWQRKAFAANFMFSDATLGAAFDDLTCANQSAIIILTTYNNLSPLTQKRQLLNQRL
jgi:hypothetical protein